MTETILTMLHTIRIQDILDIVIISIMISALLIWFKDRASRFVFWGITLLGIVYGLARFFQLYLTTVVLQAFFAIVLFVLVVIFQEDLRRFFERLALLGRFRKRFFAATAFNEGVEILAQTAANLANKKVGALIVIQGHDPLDRHLTGGHRLNGILSQPLLESIFDPHSIGHDGAVLVDGNRLMRFGSTFPSRRTHRSMAVWVSDTRRPSACRSGPTPSASWSPRKGEPFPSPRGSASG